MQSPIPILPPPAELRALRFLHEHGPSTVREYWEKSGLRDEGRAYTTTLAVFQLMFNKKRVTRKKELGVHRYAAAKPLCQLQEAAVNYVLEHVFGGDTKGYQAVLSTLKSVKK